MRCATRPVYPATDTPSTDARGVTPSPSQVRSERIVVIDDEPLVRNAVCNMLCAMGYDASSVASPLDVLVHAEEVARPDLLLVDVLMPGENGPQMVRSVRERFPDVKVLFMSGFAEEHLSRGGILLSGVHFIAKPFEATTLQEKVAQVLASSNPGALGDAEHAPGESAAHCAESA
jgi:two-component system cell cycle sensor histidine kinase/response regulator CckA